MKRCLLHRWDYQTFKSCQKHFGVERVCVKCGCEQVWTSGKRWETRNPQYWVPETLSENKINPPKKKNKKLIIGYDKKHSRIKILEQTGRYSSHTSFCGSKDEGSFTYKGVEYVIECHYHSRNVFKTFLKDGQRLCTLSSDCYPAYYDKTRSLCCRGVHTERDNDWISVPEEEVENIKTSVLLYNKFYFKNKIDVEDVWIPLKEGVTVDRFKKRKLFFFK